MSAVGKLLISAIVFSAVNLAGASSPVGVSDAAHLDSVTRLYWQRIADPTRPAAPPRFVVVNGSSAAYNRAKPRAASVCVRAGERLTIHAAGSGSSAMSLQATALESGTCGKRVRARINVTGVLSEITVLDHETGILSWEGYKWR